MNEDTVLVCRGCCCGTERRLPGVEHERHLDRLRADADGVAQVRVVDCLGPCERANVVEIRRGTDRTWLGQINTDRQIDSLVTWLRSADTGLPADLAASQIDATCTWIIGQRQFPASDSSRRGGRDLPTPPDARDPYPPGFGPERLGPLANGSDAR